MKKSLLLILFALLLAAPSIIHAASVRVDVGQLRYTVDTDTNTAELYGPVSEDEVIHDLVIPDYIEYDGIQIPVTSIRNNAFYRGYNTDNENITGLLVIGNNIKTIGSWAFYCCRSLTGSLTIGDLVTTIGDYAFCSCSGFKGSLTIGDSVVTIGTSAFSGCTGFTGTLTIGNSVTTIGNSAFYNCSGFTGSLTIGDSVITIGTSAFYKCTGFTGSLTIGDSVTTIGDRAFYQCEHFAGSLTLGNSVTSIGSYAFYLCSGFTGSLTIGNSVTTIGDHAFSNCLRFTGSLTIGNSVTTIGDYAFDYCYGFTGSLNISDSVTTIGDYAFCSCSGFKGTLTIGDSVTTIGKAAFIYCKGFTGPLTIGPSVTLVKDYAFRACTGISSLEIKSANLKIEAKAFADMTALQSITCSSITPPECVYSEDNNIIFSNYDVPLYVPAKAVDEYKVATEWEKFKNIEAINVPATSIALNISEVELGHEETVQLVATVMPDDATDKSVTWASADEAVATVDENGLVTAVAKGTTTITATTVDGLTAECVVTVKASSGVDGILGDGVSVTANGGVITVSGAGDKAVRIMTTDGKLVFTTRGDCTANVVPGIYIVAVGETVVKVVAY
ncbi:MAG: leucine-rich repeat protein [Bacteroidales bacterium]|nr:leucine-rich repeat protein [Bacteroidales bacterium]MBD5235839.1 leucine-rich repeat protein [Barnesiella sp.]